MLRWARGVEVDVGGGPLIGSLNGALSAFEEVGGCEERGSRSNKVVASTLASSFYLQQPLTNNEDRAQPN